MAGYQERRDNGDGTYSQNIAVTDSDAILPISVERRYAKMVPIHAAVSIGPGIWNTSSAWIDTDGFDKVAITLLNDAGTASVANIIWSHDQSTQCGEESGTIASGTGPRKAGEASVKARYFKLSANNGDTVAHTISTWAYLKV